MKTIGIMQPYFLPYIGYFQLINMVDEFVIYDNIKFTKKGWINRNRMLQNGKAVYFSIPIKKDSDFLNIVNRKIADNFFDKEKDKLLRVISANYKKAPFFKEFFPVVDKVFSFNNDNVFEFIYHSVVTINNYLDIKTPIIISSTLGEDIEKLKAQDKVIAICKSLKSNSYVNSEGGVELYEKEDFKKENIELNFFRSDRITYNQYGNVFEPYLSILDVCMFNEKERVKQYLNSYKIL